MKRILLFILVVIGGLAGEAEAQAGKKTPAKQKVRKANTAARPAATAANTVSLTSVSANQAFAEDRLTIADPTIRMLRRQAAGNEAIVSSSGIVGMPKRSYGFANGKILLRPTTAPSSGTMYGSGSVGTGTTISGLGTAENTIGVNGKNPYAGPWLWGSKIPTRNLPPTDSTRRGRLQ